MLRMQALARFAADITEEAFLLHADKQALGKIERAGSHIQHQCTSHCAGRLTFVSQTRL